MTRPFFFEVAPDVFQFHVPGHLLKRIVRLLPENTIEGSPNSMNKYGKLVVGELYPVMQLLTTAIADRVRRDFWSGGHSSRPYDLAPLKKRPYAFVVDYAMDKQRSLARHYDSSDVTMNICLPSVFKGGGLWFYSYSGRERFHVPNLPGRALVHPGALQHRAEKLTSGSRSNIIIWAESRKRR